MRQASGTGGPLAPNSPAGHLRRESSQSIHSDASNQNPGAGRGGFQQGGRGRGGFNGGFQPQQQGFPPNQQFRNNQGPGRGGMGVPFQQQGRPLQYPNSPHQAARSPALTNSIPSTPNMPQAMPMQGQQQFNNHFNPMQGYQVNHPSHMQSSIFKSNTYKGKNKKHRGGTDKFSNNQQQARGDARELFAHTYTPREAFVPNNDYQGQVDVRVHHAAIPDVRPGPFMSQNGSLAAWASQTPSADSAMKSSPFPSTSLVLPPFPAPFLPPSDPKIADVKKLNLSPESPDFENFLTQVKTQGYTHGFPPAFQPNMPMHGHNPYMQYPQMQQMGAYPQSPQPGYQQYIPGQYNNQAPSMSRNSSQISEQRPTSSMGGPQTPSMTPAVVSSHTTQKAPSTPSAFVRAKKSAAIVIKRPDGEALDIGALKTPVSPAPTQRTQTPPVVASTPTPPPAKVATPQHNRTDSAAVVGKSQEQIQKEIREKVAAAAGNKASESKDTAAEDAAKAAELKQKEDEKVKADEKAAADAKAKEEADAKAAADKAKADEEEELERMIREMEEADALREKQEEERAAKRAAEKAAAKAKEDADRLANAEDNDRKLKEQEREMERLEDEKERKRAEAEAKASGASTEENKEDAAPVTPSTLASKLSTVTLAGTESGASTPASDDSMGPPPPKINVAEKRGKPAALNLAPLNTKPVEPPQPSAALQSLKSARFLSVLNSSIYPEGIASPNPALNNAVTTKGKSFKYDKEFLLQFQKVFTEKPSLEFADQIKNLIGDGDASSRANSARTPGGMGPRQGSTRNQPGAFAMGSFGAMGSGKTLPPGTSSADRFNMSNGTMARPTMNNPLASFNRPGGAFPGGNMSRQPSSQNMNNMPQSPRQASRRGGSKRDNFQPSNAKAEAAAAKTMPLTAGQELKPIAVTASGWKPRSIGQSQSATGAIGPGPSGTSGHMEPDMVQRKVKAALNKMTPEKFDKIADQILAIAGQSKDEQDGRTLRQVIQLTFEKATDEAHWASMYAKFCKRMLETMSPDIKDESILDKNGNVVSGGNLFRKYLLNRCQEEFERGWKLDLPEKPEGEEGEAKTEEAAMLSDEYYIAAAAKRRGLGLVQFIGELYKLSMLTERIMHECVKKLVDYTGIPDEAEIESLTKLLKTIGGNLDSTEKGRPMMDVYFQRIQAMVDTPELPSRLKFMLMDIVDLRKAKWVSKEANKGPLTLDEVKAEVRHKVFTYEIYITNLHRPTRLQHRKPLRAPAEANVEAVVVVCRWDVVTAATSLADTAISHLSTTRRTLSVWTISVVSPTRMLPAGKQANRCPSVQHPCSRHEATAAARWVP